MPVNLSVKKVDDALAQRLRDRAARNRRSLQQELVAILESAGGGPVTRSTVDRVREQRAPYLASRGRRIPPKSESALIIRQARDERTVSLADLYDRLEKLGVHTPSESTAWIRQMRSER